MKKILIACIVMLGITLNFVYAEPIKPITIPELVEKSWDFQDKLIEWENENIKSYFKDGEYPLMDFYEVQDYLISLENKYVRAKFKDGEYPLEKYAEKIDKGFKNEVEYIATKLENTSTAFEQLTQTKAPNGIVKDKTIKKIEKINTEYKEHLDTMHALYGLLKEREEDE